MRLDLLFAHCGDLGLDVEWEDLGDVRRGHYLDDTKTIVLNRTMTSAQTTATLAHEVGHAVFGDRATTPRLERRASEFGAALIITPRQYAAAEELVGCHTGALAAELGVTPHLIEAWRRWAHKRMPLERRRRTGDWS